MGNIFDLLILLLGFFDVSVFGDWVQMIKRYRVYVSEEETCSMPNNVLGFYQRGVGRWGVHIISVDKNLPENLKIAVLLHEYAHFVEYINNKSRKKGNRDEFESHNSEWKSIYSELLYLAYSEGFINPDDLEKEMIGFNIRPYDLAVISHTLGIIDFGVHDMYDVEEVLYHDIWEREMESLDDSYGDEDIDPYY